MVSGDDSWDDGSNPGRHVARGSLDALIEPPARGRRLLLFPIVASLNLFLYTRCKLSSLAHELMRSLYFAHTEDNR